MADLSKIAAQEIGEMAQRHFQEMSARLDREKILTDAIVERTQWLRMLTMGEMKLEYVQVLEDGQLRYNDPSGAATIESPAEPSPIETCIQAPVEEPAPEEEKPESTNGKRSAKELASAS